MNGPKLIDTINRLFDQMVGDPWSRAAGHPQTMRLVVGDAHLEVQIPLAGGRLGDVLIAREGRRVVVRARLDAAAGVASRGGQEIERVVTVPADAEVSGIEARFEGEILHVRVGLRRQRR